MAVDIDLHKVSPNDPIASMLPAGFGAWLGQKPGGGRCLVMAEGSLLEDESAKAAIEVLMKEDGRPEEPRGF